MLDGRGRSSKTERGKRLWAYMLVPSGHELLRLSMRRVSRRGRGTLILERGAIGSWGMRKCSEARAAEGSLRPGPAFRVRVPSENMGGLGKNCLDLDLRCSLFWLEQSGSSLGADCSERYREGAGRACRTLTRSLLDLPKELKTAPRGNGLSPLGQIMCILEPSQVFE